MERAVVITRYRSAFGQEPQIPAYAAMHADKTIGDDSRRVASVEDNETHTIEACEPVKGSDPKIAVGGLANAASFVLQQAVIGAPGAGAVLSLGEKRRHTEQSDKYNFDGAQQGAKSPDHA